MSTQIFAVFVQLLVVILPVFGVIVGSSELTNAIQTITTVIVGLYIWYRRVQVGDIKWFGAKK